MRFTLSGRALDDYRRLPPELQKTADKQFSFLLRDIYHPSLHAKKYDEGGDVWQGRLTRGFRFYFQIRGDEYYILSIVKHPK